MIRLRWRKTCVRLSLICAILSAVVCAAIGRSVRSLDNDWRFYLGDITNAEAVDFDDSAWRRLDVPHVLSRPGTCGALRALFAWCSAALAEDAGARFRLADGTYDEVTRPQVRRLAENQRAETPS